MKRAFIDVETTGLNPQMNAIVGLACILHVGEITGQYQFVARPFPEDQIVPKALEVNGIAYEEMMRYPEPQLMYSALLQLLDSHIDKYNKADKLFFLGWFAHFDYDFLRAFFEKCGNQYFGSYFFWPCIDVSGLVAEHLGSDITKVGDFHLDTVAKYFSIPVDEEARHTALYDALLLEKVYNHIKMFPKTIL